MNPPDQFPTWVLLANAVTTLAMFGVIWMVQLVQYPLFEAVGADVFARYHAGHSARISLVVVPLMLVELCAAFLLLAVAPRALPAWSVWLGAALVVLAWASTFASQVPAHARLAGGFDESAWRALVHGNWLRTAAWSARAGLVVFWLQRLLRAG